MSESDTDTQVFPPTLREVMLRPWWIGMLVFALAVATIFAWLGQWQLGTAIDTDPLPAGSTEQVRPLEEVTEPGAYLPEPLVGQRVETAGRWQPGDFIVVSSRVNDGEQGYWVTGQFRTEPAGDTAADAPVLLAVALGWAPTREQAESAAAALDPDAETVLHLVGRLISDEGPKLPPASAPHELNTMSPAALLGRWHDVEGLDVYRPYLVADVDTIGLEAPGLVAIDSPAPAERGNVNWLNIFYAIEWAVFACFAFYMWYRLARDAWEKEVEALEDDGEG